MEYGERVKDPRWQMAVSLADTTLLPFWKGILPNNGHAWPRITYAVAMSCLTPAEAGLDPEQHRRLLGRYCFSYAGPDYARALLEQCEQVVRSVQAQAERGHA